MQYDNGFELLIAFVFSMGPKLLGLGPKSQDILIPFYLGEGDSLTDFHLRALAIRSELVLKRHQTEYIYKPTGKYIMEL